MAEWAERYRPKRLADVVGNPSAVKDLREWADSWEHRPVKKAVVLSGPAGRGKTSAAIALASDMGWTLVEMNASDARNAVAVREVATRGATMQTFTAEGEFVTAGAGRRKLIVLDEADNLFGNNDRGGVAQIVDTLKSTRQPIILIANDYRELTRRSSSFRTLAKEIKFGKPPKDTIAAVLRKIAQAEGVAVTDEAVRRLAERADGDLRAAVNDLETVAVGRTAVTEDDLAVLGTRDTAAEMFDVLREIFRGGDARIARSAVTELDESPEDLILWIDENLPAEYRDPVDLAAGFRALSRADIYLARTRRRQAYGLWGYASDMMSAGVSAARHQRPSGGTYRFPMWLARMGRTKARRALTAALAGKFRDTLHVGRREFVTDVLPALSDILRADAELRVAVTAQVHLDEREVAFLLKEEEDSEAVKRVMSEAAKIARHPEIRTQFMEEFSEE